jgi:sugar-specific transcriptional regulator TrmB
LIATLKGAYYPMPDTLDQARQAIRQRLHELDSEAGRLREALAKLGPDGTKSSRRRERPHKSSARASARRAPRGQRQAQFLRAVEKQPGAKAAEIAKEMGVPPAHVYTLARRMVQSGQVTKRRDGGYALKK